MKCIKHEGGKDMQQNCYSDVRTKCMSDAQTPLISVIIPIYNATAYINQTLSSILIQDVNCEVIAVEDPSEKMCTEIISSYQDRLTITHIINEQRQGPAENRNIGIRLAKGQYIAFLDADDWWGSGKLLAQLKLIEHMDCPFVYTGRRLVSYDGSKLGKVIHVPHQVDYQTLLKGNIIPASSVLMKTDIAKSHEQHDDHLHEDYMMWLEILQEYDFVYGINTPFLFSRLSEGGKSRNKVKSAWMHWGVLRKMKLSIFQSLFYFVHYAIRGFMKYI